MGRRCIISLALHIAMFDSELGDDLLTIAGDVVAKPRSDAGKRRGIRRKTRWRRKPAQQRRKRKRWLRSPSGKKYQRRRQRVERKPSTKRYRKRQRSKGVHRTYPWLHRK